MNILTLISLAITLVTGYNSNSKNKQILSDETSIDDIMKVLAKLDYTLYSLYSMINESFENTKNSIKFYQIALEHYNNRLKQINIESKQLLGQSYITKKEDSLADNYVIINHSFDDNIGRWLKVNDDIIQANELKYFPTVLVKIPNTYISNNLNIDAKFGSIDSSNSRTADGNFSAGIVTEIKNTDEFSYIAVSKLDKICTINIGMYQLSKNTILHTCKCPDDADFPIHLSISIRDFYTLVFLNNKYLCGISNYLLDLDLVHVGLVSFFGKVKISNFEVMNFSYQDQLKYNNNKPYYIETQFIEVYDEDIYPNAIDTSVSNDDDDIMIIEKNSKIIRCYFFSPQKLDLAYFEFVPNKPIHWKLINPSMTDINAAKIATGIKFDGSAYINDNIKHSFALVSNWSCVNFNLMFRMFFYDNGLGGIVISYMNESNLYTILFETISNTIYFTKFIEKNTNIILNKYKSTVNLTKNTIYAIKLTKQNNKFELYIDSELICVFEINELSVTSTYKYGFYGSQASVYYSDINFYGLL